MGSRPLLARGLSLGVGAIGKSLSGVGSDPEPSIGTSPENPKLNALLFCIVSSVKGRYSVISESSREIFSI